MMISRMITSSGNPIRPIQVLLCGGASILPSSPRPGTSIFLICLALCALGQPPAAGQFASGVSLVEVYATVTDARGEPVPGLQKADFVVEEDGRREELQTFAA